MQPKLRIPEKDKKEVAKAVILLKMRGRTQNLAKKAAIEIKLMAMSETIRSLAEAELRGDTRSVPSLNDAPKSPGAVNEVSKEWAEVVKDFDQKKTTWAEPALESELHFQMAVVNYSGAITPLIDAFQSAMSSNIPGVKTQAKRASELLLEAQRTLTPLSDSSSTAQDELHDFVALVEHLKAQPPKTLAEVKGTRARFDEAVQTVRSTQQAIKDQVTAINNLAKKQQSTLESLIREMVAAAVAWRKTGDLREGTEVVESLLNGAVSAVQALDGEPLSALAVQGLHSLIKGICDGIKLSAAGVKSFSLKRAHRDVMDLIDKLEADDFIQAKVDLIKMGLSWLAEPLGLIPSVGSIVRSAVNIGVGGIAGVLKKAAAKQAKEFKEAQQKKSGTPTVNVDAEVDETVEIIRESVLEFAKAALAGTVKALAKPEEGMGELLLEALAGLLGAPLQALVAEVVGEFDLVDKEQVKATVAKGRDAVAAQAKELQEMAKINMTFAFDEQAAKEITLKNLEQLGEGLSCQVKVAASPVLRSTRGVALLVGDGHSQDNLSFITSLLKTGEGYEGTVLMKEKGGSVFAGELVFNFTDDKAKELIKSYIAHYGSGDGRITRKKLTFS